MLKLERNVTNERKPVAGGFSDKEKRVPLVKVGDGCYCIMRDWVVSAGDELRPRYERVSNFTIEVTGVADTAWMIRLHPAGEDGKRFPVETKPFKVQTQGMVNVTAFRAEVLRHGPYIWHGSEADLLEMWEYVLDGYQKEQGELILK